MFDDDHDHLGTKNRGTIQTQDGRHLKQASTIDGTPVHPSHMMAAVAFSPPTLESVQDISRAIRQAWESLLSSRAQMLRH